MKKTLICIALVLFASTAIYSQKKFTKEQLIADADTLYQTIYDAHPNMFAVYPKDKFDKEFSEIKSHFKDSMTVNEFYKTMAPLIAKLEDGHTTLNPHMDIDKTKGIFLPLNIKIENNGSISVVKDYSDSDPVIPEGARIISINGYSSDKIVSILLSFVSGEIKHFKISYLNQIPFISNYLLYLALGETVFDIKYSFNGTITEKKFPGFTLQQISTSVKKQGGNQSGKKENYSLHFSDNEDIAIIDFNSFSNQKKFNSFIDSAFTVIQKKGIRNLIIDIRENGGGSSSIGDEFFQYISPVSFQQFGHIDMKISRQLKNYWKEKKMSHYLDNFVSTDSIIPFYKGELIPLRDNPSRYSGKIYLLTSNFTFSSAASFSWAFKWFKMGVIVGEETGGLAVTFGDVANFKLLNTKLNYGVSWKKFYHYGAIDENRHGTFPDYEIPADQAMDFTLELIKKEKHKLIF